MEIYKTKMPLGVKNFIEFKFPEVSKEKIKFLSEWRDCMFNKIPFLGWSSVTQFSDRKELMKCAYAYADYLEKWAEIKESMYDNLANHVTDVNVYEN